MDYEKANYFKEGFNNEPANVNTYAAYAMGPEPKESQQIIRYFACKNPACDRFSCTASREWCSTFCCPACAITGKDHTEDCDNRIVSMKDRLVPNSEVIKVNDINWLTREKKDKLNVK